MSHVGEKYRRFASRVLKQASSGRMFGPLVASSNLARRTIKSMTGSILDFNTRGGVERPGEKENGGERRLDIKCNEFSCAPAG